jgi:hypothetical protein
MQDARQHAALAAALLVGAQLLLGYWFYSYLIWFYPLLLVAVVQPPTGAASGIAQVTHSRLPPQAARAWRQPRAHRRLSATGAKYWAYAVGAARLRRGHPGRFPPPRRAHIGIYADPGTAGRVFSGQGIEMVWVRKLAEPVDQNWFSSDEVDLG